MFLRNKFVSPTNTPTPKVVQVIGYELSQQTKVKEQSVGNANIVLLVDQVPVTTVVLSVKHKAGHEWLEPNTSHKAKFYTRLNRLKIRYY